MPSGLGGTQTRTMNPMPKVRSHTNCCNMKSKSEFQNRFSVLILIISKFRVLCLQLKYIEHTSFEQAILGTANETATVACR